jgi:hypothetical protein
MDDFHFDFLMSKIDLIPRRHTSRHALRSWHETKSFLFDTVKSLARSNRPLAATPKVDSIEMTSSSVSSPTAISIRSFFKFGRPRLTHSKGFSEAPTAIAESAEVSAEEHRVVKPEPAKEKPTSALSCVKHSNLVHGTTTPEALVFCINVLTTNFILFPIASMVLNICHHHYMLRVCQKDMRTPEIDWGRIIIKST